MPVIKRTNLKHIFARKDCGFTLVEMAVVLIIFGFMMSIFMMGVKHFTSKYALDHTNEALEQANLSAYLFQVTMRRYPCPADPTLGPGDAQYGYEDCAANPNIQRVQGRDVDNADGDNDPDTGGEWVLIGALPINTFLDTNNDKNMGDPVTDTIKGKHGLDGWGRKFTYAVTENLTRDDITFNYNGGAIDVQQENHDSILAVEGGAHYVILSHGENGVGAHTENGSKALNCASSVVPPTTPPTPPTPPGAGTNLDETENCNNTNAVFLSGIKSDSQSKPYDDYIVFASSNVPEAWGYSEGMYFDNGTELDFDDDWFINQLVNTNGSNVGIGTPEPDEQLHVVGDVEADLVKTSMLCPEGFTKEDIGTSADTCMKIEAITGETDDMQCPDGQIMTGISENKAICQQVFTSIPASNCPNGAYGISLKGGLICY